MTQPTNTFDSYDSIGNREDLTDVIHNISPFDTPFLSMAKKGKATNTYHEWQTDSLAAVADNKVVEGDDVAADAAAATTRLGNYTQLSDKAVSIPSTLESVNRAGRQREMSYQMAKRSKELKRDMEHALVGLANARAAGNSTTARELASVASWIATNTSRGGSGTDPTGDGTDAPGNGTQRALTEDQVLTVQQACFEAGGNPSTLMVSPFHKRIISTSFTGNGTRIHKAEDKKLNASIEVYAGPFGDLKVVPNRFQLARDAYMLDMDYWCVAYLQAFKREKLAKTGHSDREMLSVEYTLEAQQEAASGVIADLTTS